MSSNLRIAQRRAVDGYGVAVVPHATQQRFHHGFITEEVAGWFPATTPPMPSVVTPNSRCGPSAAPTPPANSRNFVPSPPTANLVRAHFPVDRSATTSPVEELRRRSSSTLWLRSCLGPVARAPQSACARR